ncbi:MAG: 3-phosphoglycerate dehydrogenase [Oscillospiraceae bacterium]|nr:3-phosphoglycerate dehydrogenase [Oscillospiraceae bacterium]
MYNILTLNKISKSGLSNFDPEKFVCSETAENPDAVIVRSASMHDMELPANLLAVARAGAGVNNIPIEKCTENGICVFNTPGANANAVKELVICSLFLVSRKIVDGAKWCESLKGEGADVSKKVEKGKSAFAGPEIMGKTLGIIGLGAIGVLVANAAKALGMNVIGYDPFISPAAKEGLCPEIAVTTALDNIFSSSDYITLHAPLTDSTRGVINAANLEKAKDGVRILNFSRAELVDNTDILSALSSGKCAAYATDFPTDEQLKSNGVTALPHLGASTPEAEENCAVMAVKQLGDYLTNGNVKNSVNLPELSLQKSARIRITAITKGDKASEIEKCLAESGMEITNKTSAIKKDTGYCIFDTDTDITDDTLEELKSIDGVLAIRII